MRARAALFVLSMIALAQPPAPPPEVDQALRARVNLFFQDFVDGKFFEAMDLVADQTKSEYIAQGKTPLKEFHIRDISYSNNFTKATVELQVKRVWNIQGQENIVDVPMKTTWKIEKDKWVWYQETAENAWLTPMGPSDVPLLQRNSDGTVKGMPQKITQDTITAAAQRILGQVTGVDRPEITLSPDKPSTEKVTFHNGAPGSIHLDLFPPNTPGLTVKLSKTDLNFGEDATLEIAYAPASGEAAPAPTNAFIVVEPFNQEYRVALNFGSPKPATAK